MIKGKVNPQVADAVETQRIPIELTEFIGKRNKTETHNHAEDGLKSPQHQLAFSERESSVVDDQVTMRRMKNEVRYFLLQKLRRLQEFSFKKPN